MKKKPDLAIAADCFRDPVKFARKVLGHQTWSTQEAILRAIRDYPRVAVKGCHASSKTFAIAEAVLWWLARWKDAVVVTTGPSWTQVKEIVWGEIHKAAAGSRFPFPQANQTELRLANGSYAIGLSTNEAVRFQGFHGEHVLIIADEAPGLRADMWEAIEGARAGGDVRVVALGNPTSAGGIFYDAFTAHRTGWKTFTIDAFATPNLAGFTLEQLRALPPDLSDDAEIFQYRPRPYLVTRRWVYERFWEWGEQSPHWEARVRGEFPTQAEDALISLAWLTAAQQREANDSGGKVRAGIDVAEAGEAETVLAIRQGSALLELKSWQGLDARGPVAAALAPYRGRLELVNVDSIGVGAYFAKHLRDLGYRVRDIRVSEKPRDADRYANLKAELYWGLRMRFEAGDVAGLTDERALSQLATIRYNYNPRGQLQIESKEDARLRGVKSPDRAEAIMLAFGEPRLHGLYERLREQHEELQAARTGTSGVKPSGRGGVITQQPQTRADDEDPVARYDASALRLVESHRSGSSITIDPEQYKFYLRPRLCRSSDPDAASLMRELDQGSGRTPGHRVEGQNRPARTVPAQVARQEATNGTPAPTRDGRPWNPWVGTFVKK